MNTSRPAHGNDAPPWRPLLSGALPPCGTSAAAVPLTAFPLYQMETGNGCVFQGIPGEQENLG
jgi:hypothetical protein